jgi:hypothetical protein
MGSASNRPAPISSTTAAEFLVGAVLLSFALLGSVGALVNSLAP